MKIHALTVCVNYVDWLAIGFERWKKDLASWTIITDSKDAQTAAFAMQNEVRLFQTDIFYEHGAAFNKGAALETARAVLPEQQDWLLLLDADIAPEPDWFAKLCAAKPEPGFIYGAPRFQYSGDVADIDNPTLRRIPDALCDGGYFQLFHMQDPHIAELPVIEMDWSHAGVYDSHLKNRWPRNERRELPIRLVHCGEQENWWGRGNREAFNRMNVERIKRGGYLHERIQIQKG